MTDHDQPITDQAAESISENEQTRPGGLRRWLRSIRNGRNGSNIRETFEELIEQHEERELPIDDRERALLEKVLTIGELTVDDVMVPRADIVAVERHTPLDEIVGLMAAEVHSRLPVYRNTLDDAIGMVHIKDVLAATTREKNTKLEDIVRGVLYVAPSIRVLDLLLQMRVARTHMALVVDEFGGIGGLATIEDLVEQIVGEIEDEHDVDDGPQLRSLDGDSVLADARVTLEEFENRVGEFLTEEDREDDIDTLGGLVFSIAGHVPVRGEIIRHESSGIEFEVREADPRRIRRIKVSSLGDRRLRDE
ncbi:MAG TPA: magnesium/cobalt efflux protein [Rhodospirillaceae bacterium]|nr:magnesium/cobalt efflux protein [Rhodospirillaceae bacterium]HAA93594.1 magnesium/cobalt efflux protein [Rhodospirillaceae bacterium]HAT36046.1 magnesium/cobalt efflux protein [Rhodospirillaceae bacterium]